jgi:hypothetical protein
LLCCNPTHIHYPTAWRFEKVVSSLPLLHPVVSSSDIASIPTGSKIFYLALKDQSAFYFSKTLW